MADLLGGGHVPVLNGDSRANRQPMVADRNAAGAGRPEQTMSRCRQELEGDRKMRGRAMTLNDQYDSYLDASEAHTFAKLHANLGKLERKAEREHNMYTGAAGWSTEHRNELADQRSSPGMRRARSPARFGNPEQQRMRDNGAGAGSVASLLQQGEYINGLHTHMEPMAYRERQPSPRGPRAASPRGPRAPSPRAPSPMRQHPAVPPLFSNREQTDSAPPSTRCAASPRAQRAPSPRAPSPRAPPRAASPGRQRPGQM